MGFGGFSWKRALGISAAKSRLSRQIGIPLTRSGRQQKLGRMISGGGCLVTLLATVGGCTSLVLLLGLAASACSQFSRQGQPDAQFELKQDGQGRVIRLNKQTGEVMRVEGTKLVPVTPPEPQSKTVRRPSVQ